MKDERRYQEEEIREIFESAAEQEAGTSTPPLSNGFTLRELQEIGSEIGLAPERVAEAALAIDLRDGILPQQTLLGIPVSVGRIIELSRAPTDTEWELLVAELRSVFNARGTVASSGNLREWTNGNLHACIEPTEQGHRLRLSTLKGSAMPVATAGVAGMAMAAFTFMALYMTDKLAEGFFIPLFLGAVGGWALVATAFGLPRWARERHKQMEYLAARARDLIGSDPETGGAAK